MDNFMDIDKKIIFNQTLQHSITNKIGTIQKFQGRWEVLNLKENDYLRELRQIATIESIGSSTRIEGSKLNDEDVRELIDNIEINQLETRDEQEVVGYWDTLELLIEHGKEIDLSERYIFQLHTMLLKYSSKDTRHRGRYKNLSNKVVANYPDGSQKIIFNTTEPHQVSKEMEELLSWTNEAFREEKINSLIIIATFVYEFLSIHPFQDGNGRLSRLLTTYLLLREEYHFVQYVSFEHVIEERKQDYYKVLMDCQKDRYTEHENIGVWIEFFLECIISLSNKLDDKISRITENDNYFNDRQKKIIQLLQNSGHLKFSDISKYFDTSDATIKKDLKYLVDEKVISKTGERKATVYSIGN